MEMDLQEVQTFAIAIAEQAGEIVCKNRLEAKLSHEFKHGNELVTNADLAADKFISEEISKRYGSHLILSEELSPDIGNLQEIQESVWIVDPIDGTVNFAHGHNQSAISIAYVEQQQVKIGVVYNPFTKEMFSALKGGGAFLNDSPIRIANEPALDRAIIATGFPYEKSNLEPMIQRLRVVLHHCADIRRLGSAALDICWVAAGRLDGYYESLCIWDFAAARLIAKEAGAECGHFSDVPEGIDPQFHPDDLLIANPVLYPELKRILGSAAEKETPLKSLG